MNAAATEIVVRSIASGGDGVGTMPDGRTVFVPRAAPGDRLRLRNVRLHKRFARAEIESILEPGPGRVTPPCPHYQRERCGGCQLMQLSPASQRAVKARIVGDALRRIGRLDVADPEVVPSPTELAYRTKVTFALSHGHLGYHPYDDAEQVFDVEDCLLAVPELQALFREVTTARDALPARGRVVLRRDHEGALHVIVRTATDAPAWGGALMLESALKRSGIEAALWWHPEGGQPRIMTGAAERWPAAVFEQVHPAVAGLARLAAIDALGEVRGRHAWDLYAGIGDSSRLLAERGASVESVEWDGKAVDLAEKLGPSGIRRLAGAAEEMISTLHPPDVVLTNPPRVGMAPEVTSAMARSGAGRIAYLSCDPATLARDLLMLTDRYALASVIAFDQFPQTAHVETLAVLEAR